MTCYNQFGDDDDGADEDGESGARVLRGETLDRILDGEYLIDQVLQRTEKNKFIVRWTAPEGEEPRETVEPLDTFVDRNEDGFVECINEKILPFLVPEEMDLFSNDQLKELLERRPETPSEAPSPSRLVTVNITNIGVQVNFSSSASSDNSR